MPLFLVEEDLSYEVGGAIFRYQRLVHDDLARLRYLVQLRGQYNEDLYDKCCVAVALRGWTDLAGKDGLIPWPLALPARALSDADQATLARLAALVPTMTAAAREQLHGSFYVVSHLPIDLVPELARRVRALSPEELQKKFNVTWNGDSSLSTPPPAMNLPAPTADDVNGDASPATLEG